jgi:uncharacterized protein
MSAFLLLFLSISSIYAAQIDSIKVVIDNAIWQTTVTKYYDPFYVKIGYPNGDVSIDRGVCTDVIVRAFRQVDIDFQKLIHEDMVKNFKAYPKNWKLTKPDENIDHRRVQNIQKYLERTNRSLPVTNNDTDYVPGDIVTWTIPGNLEHIGLVSNIPVEGTRRFGIIHNIGEGARLEDVLFMFKISGHYRYFKKIKRK